MSSHIMIPDTQIKPGVSLNHIQWAANYIEFHKPDKVILIGDWWDMCSLSHWNKQREAEGLRYHRDIEAGIQGLDILMAKASPKTQYYFCEGNHEYRIARYIDTFPVQEGSMSMKDCDVERYGIKRIEFLKPIRLDGVYYSHYFYAKGSGRPHPNARAILNREHRSCTMGHVQTLDLAIAETANKHFIRAVVAGAFYLHDEKYKGLQGNNHWRGIIHKTNVKGGMYDLNEVSIHTLKRDYS